MGIFSFLTGSKTEDRAESATHAAPSTAPDARRTDHAAPSTAHQHGAPGTEHGARDLARPPLGEGPLDHPFMPPDAWNTDALTQPPPAPQYTDTQGCEAAAPMRRARAGGGSVRR